MKKVLLSFLLVIAATLAFTSCGGSKGSGSDAAAEKGASTAREAVERLSEAMKSSDMDGVLAVMCKADGVLLTDEDIKKAKEDVDGFNKHFAGVEIQILDEEVREEGKKVHFHTLLKKDGKEKREGMNAYNIDGRWYVKM